MRRPRGRGRARRPARAHDLGACAAGLTADRCDCSPAGSPWPGAARPLSRRPPGTWTRASGTSTAEQRGRYCGGDRLVLPRVVRRAPRDLSDPAAALARVRLDRGVRGRGARDGAEQHAPLHSRPDRQRRGSARRRSSSCSGLRAGPRSGLRLARRGRELVWIVPGALLLSSPLRSWQGGAGSSRRRGAAVTPPITNHKSQNHKSDVSALLFDFGGTLDAAGRRLAGTVLPAVAKRRKTSRASASIGRSSPRTTRSSEPFPRSLPLAETVGQLARGIAAGLGTRRRVRARPRRGALLRRLPREPLRAAPRFSSGSPPRYKLGDRVELLREPRGCLPGGRARPFPLRRGGLGGRSAAASPIRAILRRGARADLRRPAESVFVGDSVERDMAGARGVGMRHVLLAGEARTGGGPAVPRIP